MALVSFGIDDQVATAFVASFRGMTAAAQDAIWRNTLAKCIRQNEKDVLESFLRGMCF